MSLNQYKKILVIKHGSLGDITFALPAMNSIRFYFKYSKITLLTDLGEGKHVTKTVTLLINSSTELHKKAPLETKFLQVFLFKS